MSRCLHKHSITATVLFLLLAPPLYAHPGHDLLDHGAWHLVSSPFHLGVLVAIASLLFIGARLTKKAILKRTLRWSAATIFISATLIWGMKVFHS